MRAPPSRLPGGLPSRGSPCVPPTAITHNPPYHAATLPSLAVFLSLPLSPLHLRLREPRVSWAVPVGFRGWALLTSARRSLCTREPGWTRVISGPCHGCPSTLPDAEAPALCFS